jgi:predicted TIM-barrel fold metal-dependent hydrolase
MVSMGLCVRPYLEGGKVKYPKELFDILKRPNLLVEIVYPIQAGPPGWDYPFPEANQLIRQQYEELGPQKLVWGSDMPNVERNCTYKQSLTHLTKYCDFIKPKDMDLILGGNIARILKIRTDLPKTPRPRLADVA